MKICEELSVVTLQKYTRMYNKMINLEHYCEMRWKQNSVIKELIETERSYVNSLKILEESFITPLKSKELLPPLLLSQIFSCIPELASVHAGLLGKLEEGLKPAVWTTPVGEIFLDALRPLEEQGLYSRYVSNYEEAMEALGKAQKSRGFVAFLDLTFSNPRITQSKLENYLIMPIQRMPRYNLLFRELLSSTPQEAQDYPSLTHTSKTLQNLSTSINNHKLQQQSHHRIQELLPKLLFPPGTPDLSTKIQSTSRCLVLDGVYRVGMSRFRQGKAFECMVLLFTDSVWVCRKGVGGSAGRFEYLFWMRNAEVEMGMGVVHAYAAGEGGFPSIVLQHEKVERIEMVFPSELYQGLWYENLKTYHVKISSSLKSVVPHIKSNIILKSKDKSPFPEFSSPFSKNDAAIVKQQVLVNKTEDTLITTRPEPVSPVKLPNSPPMSRDMAIRTHNKTKSYSVQTHLIRSSKARLQYYSESPATPGMPSLPSSHSEPSLAALPEPEPEPLPEPRTELLPKKPILHPSQSSLALLSPPRRSEAHSHDSIASNKATSQIAKLPQARSTPIRGQLVTNQLAFRLNNSTSPTATQVVNKYPRNPQRRASVGTPEKIRKRPKVKEEEELEVDIVQL